MTVRSYKIFYLEWLPADQFMRSWRYRQFFDRESAESLFDQLVRAKQCEKILLYSAEFSLADVVYHYLSTLSPAQIREDFDDPFHEERVWTYRREG